MFKIFIVTSHLVFIVLVLMHYFKSLLCTYLFTKTTYKKIDQFCHSTPHFKVTFIANIHIANSPIVNLWTSNLFSEQYICNMVLQLLQATTRIYAIIHYIWLISSIPIMFYGKNLSLIKLVVYKICPFFKQLIKQYHYSFMLGKTYLIGQSTII